MVFSPNLLHEQYKQLDKMPKGEPVSNRRMWFWLSSSIIGGLIGGLTPLLMGVLH